MTDPKVVSLDADMTLWDFESAMVNGLEVVLSEIRSLFGPRTAELTVKALVDFRNGVADSPEWSNATHEQIREESFRVALRSIDVNDPKLACDLTALYMEHRFGDIELYPDVKPSLSLLRDSYSLGLISNGNCYPERCGLSGVFDFVIFSQEVGYAKPDIRIFQDACRMAHVSADQLVHVGDSLTNDVAGAKRAGATAVWLNRECVRDDSPYTPDFEIASLNELPELLLRL